MCDFDEAEWAEHALYRETARARATDRLGARTSPERALPEPTSRAEAVEA